MIDSPFLYRRLSYRDDKGRLNREFVLPEEVPARLAEIGRKVTVERLRWIEEDPAGQGEGAL
jgi:uncharacterized Fe-S cluster-containing radical SAM superfamily protein